MAVNTLLKTYFSFKYVLHLYGKRKQLEALSFINDSAW